MSGTSIIAKFSMSLMYLNPFCANILRAKLFHTKREFLYTLQLSIVFKKVIQPKENGNRTSNRASSIQKIIKMKISLRIYEA